ncbi:MAG: putative RNA uridine N3 methyltransferase [Promethearchaeota archaeon]
MSNSEVGQSPLSLSIALPTSFIDVSPNKAQKTQQVGRIARALAIFRVDEIILYQDKHNKKQKRNLELISNILEYMETPQYLRKHIFGKRPTLQYVGLLPPLRTPHHPLVKNSADIRNGEIREGVSYEIKGKAVVDVGVEYPLPLLQAKSKLNPQRITVEIRRNEKGKLIARPAITSRSGRYWGYTVSRLESSLGTFLSRPRGYGFIIATSRKGIPLEEKTEVIRTQWQKFGKLLLLFGSYKEGVKEILQRESVDLATVVDYSINLVCNQGTATIRTEEAVLVGLSAFRLLECKTS